METTANKKPFYQQNNGRLPSRPPEHLGKIASAMWRKVVPFLESKATVSRIDAGLVEQYCTQYEIYRIAYQSIIDDGIQTRIYDTLQDSTGAIVGKDFVGFKRNPATSVYNDALKQLNSVGEQLGLSPKGRAELAKIKPPDEDKGDIAVEMKKFLGGDDH
jgi:P27 family predicted phage terminase small subunit